VAVTSETGVNGSIVMKARNDVLAGRGRLRRGDEKPVTMVDEAKVFDCVEIRVRGDAVGRRVEDDVAVVSKRGIE